MSNAWSTLIFDFEQNTVFYVQIQQLKYKKKPKCTKSKCKLREFSVNIMWVLWFASFCEIITQGMMHPVPAHILPVNTAYNNSIVCVSG